MSVLCQSCGAGGIYSFDWEQARSSPYPQMRRDVSVFVRPREMRCGKLYECVSCGQPWYLYGEPAVMNIVPRQRLALLEKWNGRPIILQQGHMDQLLAIGQTPPYPYGIFRHCQETPCSVSTADGEQIDLAVVTMQRHAPFEQWREYRLGSEIATVRPSPHALPLAVRIASSRAEEVRMGFSPTLIDLPGGEWLALKGRASFLVWPGCESSEVTVSGREADWSDPPPVYDEPKAVYFVTDPAERAAV
ncbi:MAG TPA: hypothetical protein VF745_01935 [Steroidobacteraceae bacterium]